MSGPARRRGRPPKSDDPATRDRLLDAATAACIDVGFDAVTVADVAARVGVTPSAVYNHFADKDELLYTAGRVAIDRLGAGVATAGDPRRGAHDVTKAFLDPAFRDSRRLILELHMAGARHPELAARLDEWHREFAATEAEPAAAADAWAPTVKVFFLVLLGLCHLDDLDTLDADPSAVAERVALVVDALYR